MSKIAMGLMSAAALLLVAGSADAAQRQKPKAASVQTAAKRLPPHLDYRNVAGFTGRLNDPLYAYAADVPPTRMGPVITQWPMPNAVWW
jgi:hypothetical protein